MATAQPNSSAIPLSGGYYVPTSAPQSPPQNSSAPQPAAAKTPPPANPNSAFQTNVTTPIQSPVPAISLSPTTSLNLPQPAAPTVQSSYFSGVANDVQTTKDALQAAYDKRSADISSQLDTLKQQQQDALKAEQGLSQPFQEQLEKTQEQALHVNTNFEANQSLANELNSLVTEANQRLTSAASGFTSKSYGQAVYSSTLQDITARAGLIQSAMSAYNGQISAAYTQIDRAVAAINADRTDQLNYYQTLLSLNQQGQLDLTDQAKTLAQNQISTLQKQADDAQSTADAIKQAMTNPDTAQAYAQAGVTLTDTPEQINIKLAKYAYAKELSDNSNAMAKAGFNAVIPGQKAPPGAQVVTITDSKGEDQQYYKIPTATASSLSSLLGTMDTSAIGDTNGTQGNDILSATGLSIPVFNFLTQGTSALSRMSATDRATVMSQATDWAKNNNVDVSTIQSQYKAYNDVLQKNIERANNTSIFANEVSGTVDQFVTDTGADFGDLKAANVAQLFATGQANDPTTQKYAFDLQTMQNDLAGYYAASRGATSPDDSDLKSAANVITNGLSAGGAAAFKASIDANEKKVSNVVSGAVDSARQQVWGLFGVGDQYQPAASQQQSTVSADDLSSEMSGLEFSTPPAQSNGGFLQTIGNFIGGIFGY